MSRLVCWLRGHIWYLIAADRRVRDGGPGILELWGCARCPAVERIRRTGRILELTPPDPGGLDRERATFLLLTLALVLIAAAMVVAGIRFR